MHHHHLPDDVLWHVFSLNTSHPLDTYWSPKFRFDPWHRYIHSSSLKTAKSCSQVCHDWRRVILSSSNVWSKIIDFTSLDASQEPTEWLKAIFQRTSNQNLHVYGRIYTVKGLELFLEFVQQNWGRIETFHIEVLARNHGLDSHPAWLSINDEVSPSLRYFFLQTPSDQGVLLNAHNPNVQYLFADRAVQFAWHQHAPLFQNLRILALSMSMGEEEFANGFFPCCITQICGVLESTPRLEYLSIGEDVVHDVMWPLQFQDYPQLQIPFLQYLGIDSDISVCLAFLFHISPAAVCGLELNCSIDADSPPSSGLQAVLIERVKHYASRTNFGSTSFLPLNVRLESLHPSMRHFPTEVRDSFHFSVYAHHEIDSPVYFPLAELLLAEEFDFSTVTNLEFRYNYSDDDEPDAISSSHLYSLVNKFSALKTLQINWERIQVFIAKIISHSSTLDASHPSILPNLEELIIDKIHSLTDEPMLSMPAVVDFCKFHQQSQRNGAASDGSTHGSTRTLKRLDIQRIYPMKLDVLLHAEIFDGLVGLEVVFKKGTELFVVTGVSTSGDVNGGSLEQYIWPPRPLPVRGHFN